MPHYEISNGNWHLEKSVRTIEMSTERYYIDVTYPEYRLSGRPLSAFNETVFGKIADYVKDFTEAVEQLVLPNWSKANLKGEHSTYTAVSRVITAKFDLYPYLGGAHPNHDILTSAFDTAKNTIITLSNFFAYGSNYLERLSTLAEKLLFEKYPELGFAFNDPTYRKGFAPEAENFNRWALTDSGIIIFFSEYQVAPYAAGALEIEIPYAAIADITLRG